MENNLKNYKDNGVKLNKWTQELISIETNV